MPTSVAIAARTFGTSSVGSSVRVCTRTWLFPIVLTVASSRSGTPELRSASRIESTVCDVTAVAALKSAPPLNSMPKSSPRHANAMIETPIKMADTRYQRRRCPMKS
jgi:hypothetical protein